MSYNDEAVGWKHLIAFYFICSVSTLLMIVKEIQLLSEALWESVKTDLRFFSPIQTFVKRLAEFDLTSMTVDNRDELVLLVDKIEEFFAQYRPSGNSMYMPPRQTDSNNSTVVKLKELSLRLKSLSPEFLAKEVDSITPHQHTTSKGKGKIFIGHGHSKLWARVKLFLEDDLKLSALL